MRVAQLGHAVYGVLFVLYSRVLVRFLLVPAPAVLHAQHHRDGGQHGHGHGHGQHDHEHAVDGRLHHLGLVLQRHVLGPVAERRRPFLGAVGARVTGRALALETLAAAAGRRHACAPVGARRRHALIHVPAAVLAAKPGTAAAPEVVFQILARTTVGARLGHAIVHHAAAQIAHVAGHALATETVRLDLARTAVLARVLLAVVGQVTVGPGESGRALARVTGTVFARHASRTVPARVRLAVVGHLVARRPGEAHGAMAHVPAVVATGAVVVLAVHASATVAARRTGASGLRGRLTSHAFPLAGARAAGDAAVFLWKHIVKPID